jgi:hypothetical protein
MYLSPALLGTEKKAMARATMIVRRDLFMIASKMHRSNQHLVAARRASAFRSSLPG